MVDVTVGQQDRDGRKAVLRQDVVKRALSVITGVDDHTLLATRRRDHPAVGLPRPSREADDKHVRPFRWVSGQTSDRSSRLGAVISPIDSGGLCGD
jgi:hypothetical protein